MISQRPTWWMYVVGASFLLVHLLQAYISIWGPAFPAGLDATFERDAMRVRSVEPETLFARGGLESGDRVLAVDGLPVHSPREWSAALANVEAERPGNWLVLRNGNRIELTVTFPRATLEERIHSGVVEYDAVNFGIFLFGLFIGLARPRDLAARIGAWLFLTASIAFGFMNGWAVIWRQASLPVQFVLWMPEVSRFVIEGIFLSFFAIFPRPLFRSRWPWLLIWIPVLVTLPWRIVGFYSLVYRFGQTAMIPDSVNQLVFLRTMAYVAAGLVFLLVNYRWRADLNERRRIRVLIVGTAIGLASAALTAWTYYSQGYGNQLYGLFEDFSTVLILACPLAFGYAILRHRVLDIEVIIRQGLQYAFARRAVLGVVPALAAILIADLAVHGQETLAHILRARGWAYAGVGGLAIIVSRRRKQWLEAVDRRFFRERYDAQRVLREVIDEIREAQSIDDVAARVVTRIETALHPEFVAVMMQDPTGQEYRCLTCVPAGHACPPIGAASKLVALLHVLGKPLEVLLADSAWLQARLPEEEIAFIRRGRIDLLVLIRSER